MGKGDYRNYYKGHMDKIKGEDGGGEGRGVRVGWRDGEKKVYNCNWITIKFLKKILIVFKRKKL